MMLAGFDEWFLRSFLEGFDVETYIDVLLPVELADGSDDAIRAAFRAVPDGVSISRGKLKSLIVHEDHGGPDRWFAIFQSIVWGESIGVERHVRWLLELIDGKRRMHNADLATLREWLARADRLIAGLQEPVKTELDNLRRYHSDQIDPDLARNAASYDAQAVATTDPVLKAQAAHMAAWCRMMAGAYWCKEVREIRMKPGLLEAYCAAGKEMVNVSEAHPDGPRLHGNYLCNLVLGYWLANDWPREVVVDALLGELGRLVEPSHNLQAALGDGVGLAYILESFHRGNVVQEWFNATRFGEDATVSLEWRLWGLLLFAAVDLKDPLRIDAAHITLWKIIDASGVGGATARRLAKEILAAEQPESAGD